MKQYFLFYIYASSLFTFTGCLKDNEHADHEFEIHIHTTQAGTKQHGSTIHMQIDFESPSGDVVHHVNVRIFNDETGVEIYREPHHAHVHTTGMYSWHDDFTLSVDNGV